MSSLGLRTLPGATAYGEPVLVNSIPAFSIAASRVAPVGSYSALICIEFAWYLSFNSVNTLIGSPAITFKFPPKLSSRQRSESLKYAARFSPISFINLGSKINTGRISSAAARAAFNAGLSPIRRSLRNQSMDLLLIFI